MADAAQASNRMHTDINQEADLSLLQIFLTKANSFLKERGFELVADSCRLSAKWAFLLLRHFLIDNNPVMEQRIRFVFGDNPDSARQSRLQAVGALLLEIGSAMDQDGPGAISSSAKVVFCLMMTMLVMMMVRSLAGMMDFCLGLVVIHCHMSFAMGVMGPTDEALIFIAAYISLSVCDMAVTPSTLPCRVLVLLLGSVVVFFAITSSKTQKPIYVVPLVVSGWVIFFYTPVWFGLCICGCLAASAARSNMEDLAPCLFFWGSSYALVCLLAYLSGGGHLGAFVVAVLAVLFLSLFNEGKVWEMAAPLPFACALVYCVYYPSFKMIFMITIALCSVSANYNNGKVIPWWLALLAASLGLSNALSMGFPLLVMVFFGSYLSYGCIL